MMKPYSQIQTFYLCTSQTIVLDRPEIPMDARNVPASSDHKVSISVIVMDTVLKSVRHPAPLKPELVITIYHF